MLKHLIRSTGVALLLATFSLSGFCQDKDSVRSNQTQIFVKFIATLDAAEPIYPSSLERLIGQKPNCSAPYTNGRVDCGSSELNIGRVKVNGIDFRSTPKNGASIFVLTPLDGDCLSVDEFDKYFGEGFLSQSCTDGAICNYRIYNRPWGQLSVGLGDHSSGKCVKEIILDNNGKK